MLNDSLVPVSGLPTYVSHRVPLSPDDAPSAFERWWTESRRRNHGLLFQIVDIGIGRLELDPVTWRRGPGTATTPFRSVRGRLKKHGRRAWPIEVELLPWSSTTCEVGLRFVGRNVPSGRRVGDYHELATAAVRTLATCVRAQPPRTVVIDAPMPAMAIEVDQPDAA